jgi:hypothetical protein
MKIPLEEQLLCAKRELGMRRRVYGRMVREGRMAEHAAEREIGCMEAICKTLQYLIDQEGEQPSLFRET